MTEAKMRTTLSLATALALVLASAGLPAAQARANGFAPVLQVNEGIITGYELEQRKAFLQLLHSPGNPDKEAEKALIEDRIRLDAARRAGIVISEDAISAGMTEFAGRANMDKDTFITEIGKEGIAPETFRDFIRAGLAWREVVRAKYAGRVHISESEIDRAMSTSAEVGQGARALFSEIILPAPPGQEAQAMAMADQFAALKGEAAFAAAARQYSASASRDQGGRMPWTSLSDLPPVLRGLALNLKPGEASTPLQGTGAVAVFMLRAIDDNGPVKKDPERVEYAQYFIPGGRSETALAEAARVKGRADTCDDLYTAAKGVPASQLTRTTQSQAQVPADIALELAHLDPGESSAALVRGDTLVYLMLCKREKDLPEAAPAPAATPAGTPASTPASAPASAPAADAAAAGPTAPTREEVRMRLLNQRLSAYAESYLADLIADAVIQRP
jgi:peptidyl-prolyl cis-trans isomerase SurA